MLLASSSSIAIESNEDIHLSADGQINQIAQGSINTSMQDSIIGHASKKISLFAAQEGVRLYAGKGKIEIQAQGDGADLIARKGVQIISTEDVIDFKSAKEIVLTAGGSQLRITGSGIFPTTGGKFEVKAGQHLFKDGQNLSTKPPALPVPNQPYVLQYLVKNKENVAIPNKPYFIIDQDGNLQKGRTDDYGFMNLKTTAESQSIATHVMMNEIEEAQDAGEEE